MQRPRSGSLRFRSTLNPQRKEEHPRGLWFQIKVANKTHLAGNLEVGNWWKLQHLQEDGFLWSWNGGLATCYFHFSVKLETCWEWASLSSPCENRHLWPTVKCKEVGVISVISMTQWHMLGTWDLGQDLIGCTGPWLGSRKEGPPATPGRPRALECWTTATRPPLPRRTLRPFRRWCQRRRRGSCDLDDLDDLADLARVCQGQSLKINELICVGDV